MIHKMFKHSIVFIYIYLIFSILTSINAITIAHHIEEAYSNLRYAYYWMNYRVAFILFGNNMLVISGIISSFFGAFLPRDKTKRENIEYAMTNNFIYTILASTTTFLILLFFTDRYVFNIDFNLVYRSVFMIIGFYMYIMFWTLFSYGLQLTLSRKFIVIPLLIAEQIFELIYLRRLNIFKFNNLLPTSISRELVIQQFPFWKDTNWSSVKGVFHYGNVPMMHDQFYMPINISPLWVYFILLLYICLAFAIPLLKKEKKNDKPQVNIN